VQYIKVAFPSLDEVNILKFLSVLNADQLARIGSIIYKDHDRHHPMGAMGNIKSSKLLIVRAAISQMRDWNRQRATGKADVGYLLPVMHNTEPTNYDEIINQGFVTNLQLLQTSGLQHLVEEWKADANNYYSRLKNYYHYLRQRFPDAHLDFLRKLIPIGHETTFHMTIPPTQAMYTTDLRGTTGNDISNRWIAEQIRELTMSKNPFLRDVYTEQSGESLDFDSAEQYAGRV
jgi:hypothetical protein